MQNWQWLLCALAAAIIISLVFMYSLRCLAGLIVWLSAIGIIVVFALTGIIFLANAGVISSNPTSYSWMNIPTLSAGTTTEY